MLLRPKPHDFNPRCTTAGCAVLCGDEVLLVLRGDDQDWYPGLLAYPAGKPEPQDNENIFATMTRELVEETGISAFEDELKYHGEFCSRLFDGHDYLWHQFSYVLPVKPRRIVLGRRLKGYEWVPFDQVRSRNCIDDVPDCLEIVLEERGTRRDINSRLYVM